MGNREKRIYQKSVHLLMAFSRPKDGEKPRCIRHIIKDDIDIELQILESKLKILGGIWRIHQTVNARDVEKARIWLLKDLIDHPEHASFIDSQWRTALLQPECKVTKYFMLDIDTKEPWHLEEIGRLIQSSNGKILKEIETINGWHVITEPFDTREVCKLPNVGLLRDGYYFIKQIGK